MILPSQRRPSVPPLDQVFIPPANLRYIPRASSARGYGVRL
jgi:hypothetical protein